MTKDGGYAFPQPIEMNGRGMSLRDYFAAAALKGFLSQYRSSLPPDVAAVAREAYRYADAMLAERDK